MRIPPLAAFLAAAGLAALSAAPAPAGAPPDAAEIRRLIERLGSPTFGEREEATAALEAVGEPALPGLRKAAESDDAEVRRRAGELLRKIGQRADTGRLLAPTKVRLALKDTPLSEAVAELGKQAGCPVALHDPLGRLGDRKVTLDTGETTFWEALDRLCAGAGLVEAQVSPGGPLPVGVMTAPGAPVPPPAPMLAPPFAPKGRLVPAATVSAPGQVTLQEGKEAAPPTAYAGAARVRVARGPGFPAPAGVIALNLVVSLEPKVRSLEGFTLRLDKVVDDQGQELAPADDPAPVAAVGLARRRAAAFAAGFSTQYLPARLKAGEKPAKALREVRGAVGARLLAEPRPLLAVDDVLNSAGKTVKGDGGGAIRVLEVARDGDGEDRVKLRFEVDLPPDVPGVGEGVVVPGGRIRRVIVPAPAALPAPGGGAMLPAAPGGALVVLAGFPPGGPAPPEPAAAPAARRPSTGPSVLDDRGEPLELTAVNRNFRRDARGVVREYTLVAQAPAGRKPARLVFSDSKMVNVEIPFTLKDVPLP